MKNSFLIFIAFLFVSVSGLAQTHAFQEEIDAFQQSDKEKMPPANAILLAGSSSFRLWTDVNEYFPGYTMINRGFGGSTLADMVYFYKQLIAPYHPRQILIYCGENDFAASDTVTVPTVINRFKELYALIRVDYPSVPLAYVAMKPSPSRKHLLPKYEAANKAIAAFLAKRKHNSFIDVYKKMLGPDGSPRVDIFRDDNLHMNAKGYAIWKNAILPFLTKE